LKRRSPSRAEPPHGGAPSDAVEAALRWLRHRDRSAAQIDAYLEGRGFVERARREALATLTRMGLVDDHRFATGRATALAERGSGDALIRHDLREAVLETAAVDAALEALDSERDRAERIVARRGVSAKTARYLASRGFPEDVVHTVIAHSRGQAVG
jgi:SOS response regulatory protein OraA/RecX